MNVPFADAGSSALQPNKFVVPFPEEGRRSGKESTPHGGSLQKSSVAMSDAIWLGVERNWSTIPTAADYYQIPIPKFSVTPCSLCLCGKSNPLCPPCPPLRSPLPVLFPELARAGSFHLAEKASEIRGVFEAELVSNF
jgi:hypothetical protein